MAEQTSKSGASGAGGARSQGAKSLRGLTEEAVAEGRELRDKIGDAADAAGAAVKRQASEFTDAAQDLAAQATERVQEQLADQAGAGADYVDNLADTMRRAAREFDSDLPLAATMIRKAAAKVESVSDTVRAGDLQDLIAGTQRFARAQPAAFFGLAVLAGFGAVRFLKSSAANDAHSSEQQRSGEQSR